MGLLPNLRLPAYLCPMSRKAILLIMDGWGLGQVPSSDAIAAAKTPFFDSLYSDYPHTRLTTCGPAVGLPEGQMGNSEVGHLNLGAGRVVFQELERISRALKSNLLDDHPAIEEAVRRSLLSQRPIHLMGLLSDGGVHSHIQHLFDLIDLLLKKGAYGVAIHAFTDGRDTDPQSGLAYMEQLLNHIRDKRAFVSSISGRFYAMDRDKRWERIQKVYQALLQGKAERFHDPLVAIRQSYAAGITDEFMVPMIAEDTAGALVGLIEPEDAVLCFNFRTDRCREITQALTQTEFPEWDMHPIPLYYVTMTEYDTTFQQVEVLFHNEHLSMTLGEVLAEQGKTQIRIAETEKYPHVTFFFSGGRELPFFGEKRLLIPSPREVPTYDLKPEMSAYEITDTILPEIDRQSADFICLNFANPDMVGHTGVWEAAVKAVETVDECIARIIPLAFAKDYGIFLTADHGNADYLINPDGSPNTAHTLNPVPLFFIAKDDQTSLKPGGKLGDIAPTILTYMGIPIPKEMTGEVLFDSKV